MKKTYTVIILLLSCIVSFAQSVPSLLIPSDAASAAASGVLFNANRAYENNTAAMSFSQDRYSAWLGYTIWAPDAVNTKILGAGASARIGDKLAVGISYRSFTDEEYEIMNSSGVKKGSFTPSDSFISLGVSYKVSSSFSAGIKLRSISSSLGEDMDGSSICADISAFYRNGALDISAGILNLGTEIDWGGDSYSLPGMVKAGAAYSIGPVRAGAEAEYLLSGAFGASLGAEYCYAGLVSARAAYHYGNGEEGLASFASVGIGGAFKGISLDFAYLLASETLGGSLMLSLGYSF